MKFPLKSVPSSSDSPLPSVDYSRGLLLLSLSEGGRMWHQEYVYTAYKMEKAVDVFEETCS